MNFVPCMLVIILCIVLDEGLVSFEQCLMYCHKHGTIVFSTAIAIIWASLHLASLLFANVVFFIFNAMV